MSGGFSVPPLQVLLDADMEVTSVVVPGPAGVALRRRRPASPAPGQLAVLDPYPRRTIVQIAWERDIPVYEVGQLAAPETLETLAKANPDVVVVACFPRLVPAPFRALGRLGALNIHPSLLPANRGPEPLFWVFRLGRRQSGVTLHMLTDQMDAGPILARAPIAIDEGVSGEAFEHEHARVGGALLIDVIQALDQGTAHLEPQDEAQATYFPMPSPEDFIVTGEHPARWAFNFIRGVSNQGTPVYIAIDQRLLTVCSAESFNEGGELGASHTLDGDTLQLQCAPGVLTVRIR